jgi:urea transport system permease protein
MGEYVRLAGQLFNGIGVASILLLAALGLALSFGLMRVINMAHGELLMVGGYLTYVSSKIFAHSIAYPLWMIVAFVGTALFGGFLEITLIRRLYGRPLDTLLAARGVSLIMQQAAHGIFGPIGDEVTAPSWLAGSFTVASGLFQGFGLPPVQLFISALRGSSRTNNLSYCTYSSQFGGSGDPSGSRYGRSSRH